MKRIKFIFKVLILTIFSSLFIWFVNADIIFPSSYDYPSSYDKPLNGDCIFPFSYLFCKLRWDYWSVCKYDYEFTCKKSSFSYILFNLDNISIIESILILILFFSSIIILINLKRSLEDKEKFRELFYFSLLYLVFFYLYFLKYFSFFFSSKLFIAFFLLSIAYIILYLIFLKRRLDKNKFLLYVYDLAFLIIVCFNIYFIYLWIINGYEGIYL